MRIDPNGWWLTLPMLGGLVWFYLQPADHVLKAFWRHLVRSDAQGLATLAGIEWWQNEAQAQRAWRWLFRFVIAALALATVCSLAANLGWLPRA